MYKIINPFINLAQGYLASCSRFVVASGRASKGQFSELWQSTLASQVQFVNEYTQGVLDSAAQIRKLMNGHVEKLHHGSERVLTELAYSGVRAVAIATQARREKPDRRVFSLPLPTERRGADPVDRRLPLPLTLHHAAL